MSADVQRGVIPLTVSFTSSGSTDNGFIMERRWDFGDGATSAEISPTHTYTTRGAFTVTLTLTDDQGLTASKTLTISVTERPVARFTVSLNGVANVSSAPNAPATFTFDGTASYDPDAQPGDTLLYRWDFGDGSRELLSQVTHTFATAGTYRVRLTVTDAVGVTGYTDRIIQVGIPQPTIAFRSPSDSLANLVCTPTSPLWAHVVFNVEPGVPRRIRAGLDGDRDACEAMTLIYDATTGGERRRLSDGEERLRTAAFSANGHLLLTGGDDGTAHRYDLVAGGAQSTAYTGSGSALLALAWAPDGGSFAAGYRDGTVVVRTLSASGTVTATQPYPTQTAAVNAVAYSSDGVSLITGDNSGKATVWNVADGTVKMVLDHHGAAVTSVVCSPRDPQRALTGSTDAYARLWSLATGQVVQEFGPVYNGTVLIAGHAGTVTSVAFSPDGGAVATASQDKTAKLWDVATGSQVRTFTGHTAALNAIAFSPNGTQLATGSDDGSAIVWLKDTGDKLRTLQPCVSPIAVVAFSPDGSTLLAAVGAYNDIKLDSNPAQGNDLNLAVPTALQIPSSIQTGEDGRTYYLWSEVQTDRSSPVRVYAAPQIRVVPPFVGTLDDPAMPTIPYETIVRDLNTQDAAAVIAPITTSRQIFSLGSLSLGDRIFVSLLSLPGYGEVYTERELVPTADSSSGLLVNQPGFSLMMLDGQQSLYSWYDSGLVRFSRDSKLIIGHDSPQYYLVLDGLGGQTVPSVSLRVQRGFSDTTETRTQYVYLNFGGGKNIAVANSAPFDIAAFTIPNRNPTSVDTVRNAILARVADLLSHYGFVVSDAPPTSGTQPRLTIYFDVLKMLLNSGIADRNNNGVGDAGDLYFWGMPDYIDPRDDTLSGRAVVVVGALLDDPQYAALADGQLGLTIGNGVLHQIGLMCGLRETNQPFPDDIMTITVNQVSNAALDFSNNAPLAARLGLSPVGIQNAPELLAELFGAH
jgi:WD40 repeat protein